MQEQQVVMDEMEAALVSNAKQKQGVKVPGANQGVPMTDL